MTNLMKLSVIALLTGTLALVGCGDDGGGGQAGSGGTGGSGGAGGGTGGAGGGVEFCGAEEGIQKTLYDLPCELTIEEPPLQIPLAVELCAKASVPNNGLVQGVETAMTHSVDVSIDPAILGLLMMFVDDAALSAAATTMTITNGTTTEALNELPAPLDPIEPVFSLDTVDTNITATADPVTVAPSAFEATITGLGDLMPPDGEFTLSNDSDECGAIELATGAEIITFDVVAGGAGG